MTQQAHFKVFQASAGAGKTYTIVKEYLKLCLQNEAQTDNFRHILAITFTNAAANEMKAKIIAKLCEIIGNEPLSSDPMAAALMEDLGLGETELKRNAQRLLNRIIHDYSSFCVSTIDAFVQRLSRTFAHDLGLPGQYAVSVDDDEVAQAVADNIGLQISSTNHFLTELMSDFCENAFLNQRSTDAKRQLSEFVGKLLTEKAFQKDGSGMDEEGYKEAAAFLDGKTSAFEKNVRGKATQILATIKDFGLDFDDLAYGRSGFVSFVNKVATGKYEAMSQRFLTVSEGGKWWSAAAAKRLPNSELESIGQQLCTALKALRTSYEEGIGAFLFHQSQRNTLYFYALRAQIKAELELMANEEEVVHISEFNKLLQRVLGDFSVPFVYERMGELFSHIFVDEFQDTSVMQWQNLLPLVDNALSSGGSAMVVGDGKQSIYRFRSGEVGQIAELPLIYAMPHDEREPVFSQYQKNIVDSFSFNDLRVNYRSFGNVVRFNNAFFSFASETLAEHSRKVYADKNETFGKEVSIEQFTHKKEEGCVEVELYNAESQHDYPLERVKMLVEDLTQRHGYSYGDITILTRRKELGSEIANHLNDNGIPVVSQVSVLLSASNKVQLLVSALRHLVSGTDEVAIAQVLYFYKCVKDRNFDGDTTGVFDSVKAIADGKLPLELGIGGEGALRMALSKSTNLYDLCVALLRVFGLDSIRDAFVNYFLDEVFKWQSSTFEGIAGFLEFWDKKKSQLAVKSVSDNAVNIMTIHKSKGLEFKVVIYPEAITDLNEKIKKNEAAEVWVNPAELGFEPVPHLDKVLFRLDKKSELMGGTALKMFQEEEESNRLDNLNLLYVAFTRAVQRLYVIADKGKDGKPNLIRDFLGNHSINKVSESEEVAVWRFGDDSFINPDAPKKDENENADATDSVSSDWFEKISIDAEPSMFWISPDDDMQPREWGELVHQILSEIRTSADADSAFMPYLMEGTINQEKADMLKNKLLEMARQPEIADAFSDEAKVKNECEILSNGEILRPDRYAELSDCIYLLDYKTGKKETKYHEQLKRYIGALQGMVEKEIRAYLVYLTAPIEVEKVVMDTLF